MAEIQPPLFVFANGQFGADELGLPFRDILSEGTRLAGDLLVSAPGGMNIRVASGGAWIEGDTDTDAQPCYRVRNVGNVDIAIEAADPANPRKDIVIAEVLDAAFSGASYSWRLRVVKGVAAGAPVEPALPDSAIKLAVVTVPAAAAAIVGGNIADSRVRAQVGAGDVLGPTSDLVKLADVTLGADAASIDIQGIPGTYAHLELDFSLRSTNANTDELWLRFNNDSGAAKYAGVFAGQGPGAADAQAHGPGSKAQVTRLPGGSASAGHFAAGRIVIPEYASGKRKQFFGHMGLQTAMAANSNYSHHLEFIYDDVAAINRITLFAGVGPNLLAGSRATLYGRKG